MFDGLKKLIAPGDAYSRGQFRWRFAEQTNQKEFALKQQKIGEIERFWEAFAKHGAALIETFQSSRGKSVGDFILKHLPAIDSHIMWECAPDGASGMTLELSAEHKRNIRPLIATMLELAPKIPGWKFSQFRKPHPPELITESGFVSRFGKPFYPFSVACDITSTNGVELTFSSPYYTEDMNNQDLCEAFLITEMVIGEEELEFWANFISTKADPTIIEGGPTEIVQQFSSSYLAAKAEILSRLPERPYFELPEPETVTSYQLAKDAASGLRFTGHNGVPAFYSILFEAPRFASQRLSKFGEKFCYIQFFGDERFIETDIRTSIDDTLIAELGEAKVGTVFGGGLGVPSNVYIDLCLLDVDAAIPILRRVTQAFGVPRNAKLRFYDPDWVNEWVGMYPDTNAPNDSTRMWEP